MKRASAILRYLIGSAPCLTPRSSALMVSSVATVSYSTVALADISQPLFNSTISPTFSVNVQSPRFNNHFRSFSSPSSAGPSNIVSIESEEQFNTSLRKVQDESLPAIFYFTAAWCGPCKLLSPAISELSEKYPHVTTYKVDIDKELGGALTKLKIFSVPTVQFFHNGKKDSEFVGVDVQRLKDTMERLYKC
ncbi:unnamed protein product [Cuscuta campestris]|uniref:Thioredoxin domain-containing protein n=2 Tax=Cuscuta sect. Cleistogrammica TaxID=1824901 RepID=A0A484K5T2_9ASTE|nr:hypothetical protein DM860_002146 [Cuscuta australis]VFQ59885.1 unnamed protein product [Cuscuta campestris]VFQ98349.1 unnamed protein product [Cuscuta campestris]